MVKEDFWYNGISAKSMGITLREPVVVGGAIPRIERISVPGRNGDLIYFDGSYENRPAEASCFALKAKNVMQNVTRINNWLLGNFGYKELVIPEDRDHFFLATVENGAEINTKLAMLAPFEIEFSCKPQRFLNFGKEMITIQDLDGIVTNPTQFPAKPLIHFYTSADSFEVFFGDETISSDSIGVSDFWFDCETQNAYRTPQTLNSKIKTSGEIVLRPGANTIGVIDGISKIEIVPRWWEL